jgi:ATP-binding cassette subfamily F protein uup
MPTRTNPPKCGVVLLRGLGYTETVNLVTAQDLSLAFSGAPVLDNAQLSIEMGERVCLVGRNGEGKSCLMRILTGDMEPDGGHVRRHADARIAYLPQEVPETLTGTANEVVLAGLGDEGDLLQEYEALSHQVASNSTDAALLQLQKVQDALDASNGWDLQQQVETQLQRLDLSPSTPFSELSGGMKRQVLLARALAGKPNLLILDEPTNHLDIRAIEWLEGLLTSFDGAVLFVTHDRMFLRRVATRIIDLDRGRLTSWPGNFERYQERKQAALENEDAEWARQDKKLAKEEVWVRQGIKARRTRNEGRVRALKGLRIERQDRRDRVGQVNLVLHEAQKTGKRVIEASDLTFAWPDKPIVQDLTANIIRGDRIALIGPNGCGKTTLIRLLLGELEPESGTVRLGTKLKVVYFDQLRAQIDPEKTVQENLADGNDTVVVGGQSRHVFGYLQDFLFSPDRARSPVRILSGGERNRLLLAKMFVSEANLLVMDEPTNDLDTETLELLETVLLSFKGTLLLVSHDREFINNVVSHSFVFDEDGEVRLYAGGYDDWLHQRPKPEKTPAKERPVRPVKVAADKPKKLSFKEKRDLEELPGQIEALESEQAQLHQQIQDPDFFKQEGNRVAEVNTRLEALESELMGHYARWEALELLM